MLLVSAHGQYNVVIEGVGTETLYHHRVNHKFREQGVSGTHRSHGESIFCLVIILGDNAYRIVGTGTCDNESLSGLSGQNAQSNRGVGLKSIVVDAGQETIQQRTTYVNTRQLGIGRRCGSIGNTVVILLCTTNLPLHIILGLDEYDGIDGILTNEGSKGRLGFIVAIGRGCKVCGLCTIQFQGVQLPAGHDSGFR